jgi:hypothetical protein
MASKGAKKLRKAATSLPAGNELSGGSGPHVEHVQRLHAMTQFKAHRALAVGVAGRQGLWGRSGLCRWCQAGPARAIELNVSHIPDKYDLAQGSKVVNNILNKLRSRAHPLF